MTKRILAMTLAAALIAGTTLSTTGVAEAANGRNGAAAAGAAGGLVGGLLLGGALAAPRPAYGYEVEPEPVYVEPACYWTRQQVRNTYDYGYHWERVRVCD